MISKRTWVWLGVALATFSVFEVAALHDQRQCLAYVAAHAYVDPSTPKTSAKDVSLEERAVEFPVCKLGDHGAWWQELVGFMFFLAMVAFFVDLGHDVNDWAKLRRAAKRAKA